MRRNENSRRREKQGKKGKRRCTIENDEWRHRRPFVHGRQTVQH